MCPLLKIEINKKQDKPCITNTLKNSVRKKNKLYIIFLRNRTKESETRYKIYKNKLVRKAEKQYYNDQLNIVKNDTRKTC